MANDRMFLRNKITGKSILLAKHLAGGWYTGSGNMSNHLNEFFDEHFDEFYVDPRAYEIDFEHSRDCTKEKCVCGNGL